MKDFEDFISEDELVLVNFYAVWCGQCKTMLSALEEYKKLIGSTVRVLKLDIDSSANADIVQDFCVGSVPTLIFFRGGKVLWRSNGITSVDKLKELSNKFLAGGFNDYAADTDTAAAVITPGSGAAE